MFRELAIEETVSRELGTVWYPCLIKKLTTRIKIDVALARGSITNFTAR